MSSPPNGSPKQTIERPVSNEELTEMRSTWLSKLFSENPQLLALRERVLPWTGGYSFANAVHTNSTVVLSHMNRHVLLELIYQHFLAIGMNRTAEILKLESGHEFQKVDQPWDRTNLLLLTSLGILPRENPWTIKPDPHQQFVEETLEEDFFATQYHEDPDLIYKEYFDRDLGSIYYEDPNNSKSPHCLSNLRACSLRHLVVLLVTAPSELIPDEDLYRFFLSLQSITSNHHFLEHLIRLFDIYDLIKDDPEKSSQFSESVQLNLRRNIINLIKKWVHYHGLFIGRKTLKSIGQFLHRIVDLPEQFASLEKYATPTIKLLPGLTYGMNRSSFPNPSHDDEPRIPDPQILLRPGLRIIDPDPLETARQVSLYFHKAFAAVHSGEFMIALATQTVSHQMPTLIEYYDVENNFTLQCLETIALSEPGARSGTVSRLVSIAEHLVNLSNFDAAACILRALREDQLRGIEALAQQQIRDQIKKLCERCGEDPKEMSQYNKDVMNNFESWKASIPNIRMELKMDIDKNPSFIDGLINWEKRWFISQKPAMLYRFQNKPFLFWSIPQIQNIIQAGPTLNEGEIFEKLFSK